MNIGAEDACATDDKLDMLLDKLKAYKNNADSNFEDMRNGLSDIEASCSEQLLDGRNILK